jgi:multicomponent Na+:H+ antiporter subunit A
MGIVAVLCIVFGIAPQLLTQTVIAPAVRGLGFQWQIQASWFGILTGSGSIGVTLGAAAVLLLAILLVAGAYRLARVPATSMAASTVPVFTGGDPLPVGDSLSAVDFAEMAEEAFKPVYSLDPDPLYLLIWRNIRDGAGRLRHLTSVCAESRPLASGLLGAAVLAALVWL